MVSDFWYFRFAYTDKLNLDCLDDALVILQWSHNVKADKINCLCKLYITSKMDKDIVWHYLGVLIGLGLAKTSQTLIWTKSVLVMVQFFLYQQFFSVTKPESMK
jgi:hypothetical protein